MSAGAPTAGPAADRGLFVYAVVPAGSSLPDGLRGVDDEPLTLIEHGRVAAVVSELDLDRPPGRRAELTAYARVVERLAEEGTVAPVRFGSVVVDESAVDEVVLGGSEDELTQTLDVLRGRQQFNLRASYVEDVVLAEVVAADPAVAELRARTRDLPDDAAPADKLRLGELVSAALEAKGVDDADALLDAVLPLTAGHELRETGSPEHLLDVALLVDRDRAAELEERLEGLAEAVHERIRLSLLGPLPAYDFVGGSSWDS